jgi:hypothetical protein
MKYTDEQLKNMNKWEWNNLAQMGNTSPEVLDTLAKLAVDDWKIRKEISYNDNTSSDTLRFLAKDSAPLVRIGVAEHSNTPVDVLEILAEDTVDWRIPHGVATNENTPERVLKNLIRDYNTSMGWVIQHSALKNPNLSESYLKWLATHSSWRVKITLGERESTPLSVLEILASDYSSDVRHSVSQNEKASQKILLIIWSKEKLDPDYDTLQYLLFHPNCPKYLKSVIHTLHPSLIIPF